MLLALYTTIWLTSSTQALVAQPSRLQTRAEMVPDVEYPPGYDVTSCSRDSTNVFAGPPATLGGIAAPSALAQHPGGTLTARELAPLCRQVGIYQFSKFSAPASDDVIALTTPYVMIPPGVYVLSVKADKNIRGLVGLVRYTDDGPLGHYPNIVGEVDDNRSDALTLRFQISKRAKAYFIIDFWESQTSGDLALFKIGPG